MNSLIIHRLSTFTRGGAGGNPACVVVEPQPLYSAQRQSLTLELGALTAFVPAETPDPLPVSFFDPAGPRAEGEQVLIAIFRAMSLTGRTTARRIRLETDLGIIPVQEEVFRRPSQAQVWIEVEMPRLVELLDPLDGLRARVDLPGDARAWRSGGLLLMDAGNLAAVRGTRLEPAELSSLLPSGLHELLLYSTETSSPFSDVHVRHWSTRGGGAESPASVTANAALGVHLWHTGVQKTFLSIDQGFDCGVPCRVSVWLEGDGPDVLRVSVGGQVGEIERFERSWPGSSV